MSIKNQIVSCLKPLTHDEGVLLMGCDPEFFFLNGRGQVVGAEKVLPEKGLKYIAPVSYEWDDMDTRYDNNNPMFIIDGVQAEINPTENTCRALLGNEIHTCFKQLRNYLKREKKEKLTLTFDPLVKITQAELDSLSDKSKVFGCAPSNNVYMSRGATRITVNPKKYLKRSACGHIHLGTDPYERILRKKLKTPELMVPLLDLVVANSCVLIDRHPGNKERRQNYGRCGEYRVKPYGLEYRSLSNFWLNSYQLMSLVMGLCRQTVEMVDETTKDNNYVKALMNAVPRIDVIKAVQNNDWNLAYANFKKIEAILLTAAGTSYWNYPISNDTINKFHYFVKKIKEHGLTYWFKRDPFTHWCNLPEGHDHGWEAFCNNRIRKAMKGKYVPIDLNKSSNKFQLPMVAIET